MVHISRVISEEHNTKVKTGQESTKSVYSIQFQVYYSLGDLWQSFKMKYTK